MRYGVVSDIHGNLPALLAVVADAGAVDGWLNLGDIASGPLWPAETVAWLMARDAEGGWQTLAGNHERQLLGAPEGRAASDRHAARQLSAAQKDWLAALPPRLDPAPGLVCVHGSPRSDVECLLETVTPAGLRAALDFEVLPRLAAVQAALLLCGHTHLPREMSVGAMRVANPGSVGLPAYDHDEPWPHRVENGSPHARYACVAGDGAAWRVELRAVAYDWNAAADRAESHGRGDWADALRSGRVGRLESDIAQPP